MLPGNNGRDVGETYAQEVIQRNMIRWVKANGNNPFFLFYAIALPHGRHEIDDCGIYSDKPWTDTQKAYAAHKEAWAIKRERDSTGWTPPSAVPIGDR